MNNKITSIHQQTIEALIMTCDIYRVAGYLGINVYSTELNLRKLVIELLETREYERCIQAIEKVMEDK